MSSVGPDYNGTFTLNYLLERNGSQVHRMRSDFESERKMHRRQFYDSIIRNERSAETMVDLTKRTQSDTKVLVNPRWHKSLVRNFDVKRRLFHDHNSQVNNSISVPNEQEDAFMMG